MQLEDADFEKVVEKNERVGALGQYVVDSSTMDSW